MLRRAIFAESGRRCRRPNGGRNRAATKDFPFQNARLRRSGSRLGSVTVIEEDGNDEVEL
jgi:hypothetical protein